MYSTSSLLVFSVAISCGILGCKGSIFDDSSVEIPSNAYTSRGLGMFTKETAPFGSHDSYISFDFEFDIGKEPTHGKSVELVFFQSDVMRKLGKDFDGESRLCCWKDQADQDGCTLGRMIMDPELATSDYTNKFYYWSIFDPQNNDTIANQTVSSKIIIQKEGIWYQWIVYCADDEDAELPDITFSGTSTWMNPYGQIPADIFAYLPLYMCLSFLYFVVGIAWAVLSWKYRDDIMFLQNAIAFVCAAGFVENFVFSLDYIIYNSTGKISVGFNVVEVFFSTTKRTASYICLIMVCVGATIIKPGLEKQQKRSLIAFGIIYYIFSWFYQFVQVLRYTPQTEYLGVPESAEVILLIPVSICDFIFLYWSFKSLIASIGYLSKHSQEVKLKLFKTLGKILLAAYVISILFFILEVGFLFSNNYDKYWKGYWFFDGYYSILHFILLAVVAYLWRPSANNKRYAFSEQLDDGTIEMSSNQNSDQPRV